MATLPEKIVSLFGFSLVKENPEKEQKENEKAPSFAIPQSDDGAVTITTGSHFGTYLDFDVISKNEIELITKYREMAMQPELEEAINQIVNEAIVTVDEDQSVSLNLDNLKQSSKIKKRIEEEFDLVLKMMDFKNLGQDLFRRWYIDGRLHFQAIIDETKPKNGLKELRYIDPRRIKKVREVSKKKDQRTGIEIVDRITEYYLYNEYGQISGNMNLTTSSKIAIDSVISTTSGLMDSRRVMVMSFINKAIKPLNQLRMVEDSMVINQLVRAPDRRVFYVGTGNMPTIKANQYMKDVISQYRNKLVYDSTTGEIRDDRKFMSIMEDIWLPVTANESMNTKVDNLAGADNTNETNFVEYLQKKLYKALSIPISRLDSQDSFGAGFGRSTEVSREEINFNKFIERLRNRFSIVFDEALRIQLILKGVCSEEEWKEIKEDIQYDFLKDNNFEELKDSELWMNRFQMLTMVDPFVGKYVSLEWAQKEVLKLDDEEIEKMQDQIDKESVGNDLMGQGNAQPSGAPGQPGQEQPGGPYPMQPPGFGGNQQMPDQPQFG